MRSSSPSPPMPTLIIPSATSLSTPLLAFTVSKKKKSEGLSSDFCFYWSGGLDSNQRPLDPQSSALPNCATTRACSCTAMEI